MTGTAARPPAGGRARRVVVAGGVLFLAAAAADAAVRVTPVVQEVATAPGGTVAGAWRLRNESDAATEVAVSAVPLAEYLAGRRDTPPPDWLEVSPETVPLARGEEREVRFVARLPAEVAGERTAFVFFAEAPRGGGTALQGRIGVALYVLAAGTAAPVLTVERATPQVGADRSVRFLFEIATDGNVHLRPRGSVEVAERDGRAAGTAAFGVGLPVLPAGRERFVTAPTPPLPPGEYVGRWRVETGEIDGRSGPSATGEVPFTVGAP